MTRKLHELKGTINYAWLGKTKNRHDFYALEITRTSLFKESETTLYAFYNLVDKDIWNTLEQETFKGKTYHFFCEKRVRGWRLRKCEEIK